MHKILFLVNRFVIIFYIHEIPPLPPENVIYVFIRIHIESLHQNPISAKDRVKEG